MRRGDGNDDAGLSDPDGTDPVDDRHAPDVPALFSLLAETGEFFFRHLRVGLIIERDDLAPFVVVSCGADEGYNGSGLWVGNEIDQPLKINRFSGDPKHHEPPLTGGTKTTSSRSLST